MLLVNGKFRFSHCPGTNAARVSQRDEDGEEEERERPENQNSAEGFANQVCHDSFQPCVLSVD